MLLAHKEFRHYNFRYQIPDIVISGPVPSCHVVKTWVENFEETGSVLKKKPS